MIKCNASLEDTILNVERVCLNLILKGLNEP